MRWIAPWIIVAVLGTRAEAERRPRRRAASASVRTAAPPSMAERLRGVLGIVAILGLAYALSENRRAISRRVLFWGLALQWGFALLVLRLPAGERVLKQAGDVVKGVLDCALEGAGVRLRRQAGRRGRPGRVRLRVPGPADGDLRRGPVRGALSPGRDAVDRPGLRRGDGETDGGERGRVAERRGLALPRPDRGPADDPAVPAGLTRSELLTVMTSGMAHVSGGVMAAYFAFGVEARHILTAVIMTAPGTILLAKMLVPETGKPETLGRVRGDPRSPTPTCSTPPRAAPARGSTGAEHRRDADLVPRPDRPGQQGAGRLSGTRWAGPSCPWNRCWGSPWRRSPTCWG